MKRLINIYGFSKGNLSLTRPHLSTQGSACNSATRIKVAARVLITTAFMAFLGACASKPVVESASSRLIVVPQFYTVKQGDTLSQIASRYRLDYREIAQLNNIDSSYTIYTNQSLRLHSGGKDVARMQVRTSAAPAPTSIQTQRLPAQAVITTRTQPTKAVTSASSSNRTTPPPILPNTPSTLPSGLDWKWPAQGSIISQFNPAQDIKGIRIGGRQGDPVRASADGEVVYASDRLTEYGNLVLIRHINGYVTAYAHNNSIVVKENDRVKAGQKIAEMGSSGTNQTMVEFQIRLNGKPINPATLLPTR